MGSGKTSRPGYSSLHYASEAGHQDVVEVLLKYGGDCNTQGLHGFTPLHLASRAGHVDIVHLLLASGADVNAEDKNGKTPPDYANEEMVKVILDVAVENATLYKGN